MQPKRKQEKTFRRAIAHCIRAGLIGFVFFQCVTAALAQQQYNFNIGGGFTIPQGDTSEFTNVDGNFEIGGGINIFRGIGIQGEYMWNGLPLKDSILRRATIASAHTRLQSLTGNIILRLFTSQRGWGVYFIGGGGWYRRSWNIKLPEDTVVVTCDPLWTWLNHLTCVGGVIDDDQTIASGHADGAGWNLGGGMTRRLGDSPAMFYAEVRYHRPNHDRVNSEVLPVTLGFRW